MLEINGFDIFMAGNGEVVYLPAHTVVNGHRRLKTLFSLEKPKRQVKRRVKRRVKKH